VVQASMTDHLIQRRPPAATKLLAPRQEASDSPANAYHGPVKRYLLDHEAGSSTDALYDAAAQIIDNSNPEEGIPALAALLASQHPDQPNFLIELGDARRHAGDTSGAIDDYRRALTLDPLSSRAQRRLGAALASVGRLDEARAVLGTAIEREPSNALLYYEQALVEARSGSAERAIADLRKALQLRPRFDAAQNTLGSILAQSGDLDSAATAFRAALTINPYSADARANFARLLASKGDWKQAAFHLNRAVQLDPANATLRADYAVALSQLREGSQRTQNRARP